VFAANPARDSALIDFELLGSGFLRPEEGDEVLENSVHTTPQYGNTHILYYGNTDLQAYGSTRNTSWMEFKDRLKVARKHAKLNQDELARRAGITQTSISDLERGKSKATSFAAQIASVCGVSPIWLVTGNGEMLNGVATFDDFVAAQDRGAGSSFLPNTDLEAIDHYRAVGSKASALAALASPRSQTALKKIADAAESGRLTESDILLLEKIADRIASSPATKKEGANARIARMIKNAPKDSE
jgi:transcriptional regulator with XRE-family HTH domain